MSDWRDYLVSIVVASIRKLFINDVKTTEMYRALVNRHGVLSQPFPLTIKQ